MFLLFETRPPVTTDDFPVYLLIYFCAFADWLLCIEIRLVSYTPASPVERHQRRIHLRFLNANAGSANTVQSSVSLCPG
ncbi:hypothetical protein MB901379_01765 [Mycobacterium basiliense]|uniref:Uncharacterized protein n=1 Tax=Mycobacterium basiliense TaxID=2094119 RepID=A0A447GCU6_9MYCO|nr:hypothetical protein MB901379_01765 [Mycobacterium basiliense]